MPDRFVMDYPVEGSGTSGERAERTGQLELVDAGGKVLDVVTLAAGAVHFKTGAASALFTTWTAQAGSVDKAFDVLSDWSNGYLTMRLVV
jgi:hypothetical protein